RENQPPQITAAPPNSATLGTQYRYPMQGSDPDGDLLLWSLDQAPSGMSIHSTTGEITWTPTAEQLGEQEVAVRLTDAQGSYTGVAFTLTARGTNIAPLIVSTPLTETSLGSEYLYQVLAADPDGDALTFSLDQAPDGMSINEHGVITWTPTATGSEPISVLVTDSLGATTTHSYTLEVEANARNLAPTITSTPLSYGSAPGQEYTYQLSAVDPEEGENVTYQLLSSPDNLILDPQTGLLQWTPSASQAGSHLVQVAAVDSQGLPGVQGFYLNVRNNSAPVILSAPNTELFEGQTFRYDVLAIDPDGDNLSYQLSQAPEGMTIDRQGRIIWDAREGTYDAIEATVTDEYGVTVTQSIPLQVSLDEENPQVNLFQSFDFAYPNQEVLFAVQGSDNLGIAEKALTINGTPVPLDAWGSATWTFAAPGLYTIEATVVDNAGNKTTETLEFTVSPLPGEEVIDFNLNLPQGTISEATELLGEITAEEGLQSYKIEVAPLGTENFITLFEQQGEVPEGKLGTLDPTLLANGAYTLRVSAIDNNNFQSYTQTQVEVSSELKLGNFQLSFTDLEIPLTGIPITVTRTYDSLYAHEQDNFGQGWRLEFRDTNLQTSVPLPSEEQKLLGLHNGFKEGDKVYITLPGGERQTFTFKPKLHRQIEIALSMGAPLRESMYFYEPKFVAEDGSDFTLSVNNVSLLRHQYTGVYHAPNALNYNPAHFSFGGRYTLTSAEGVEYQIDAGSGDLLSLKDTNGNTLNYSDAGIVSSTGVEVKFERDAEGRISKVIDPAGEEIRYNYDEKGDLVSVVDREGNETKYYYENEERAHYLTRIEDPLGREGIRVEYGEDGRLSKTIDVNGEAVELVYDTEGQTQIVKDLYGKETFYAYDKNGNITQEIQPSGLKIERTYERDKVTSETVYTAESGAEGWTTSYEYDHWGNLSKETDPLGNVTLYTNDSRKRLLSETDALGNTTKYEYDYPGNLLSSTDALGNRTEYSYDARGNLLSLTDARGNVTQFTYDFRSNVMSVTDAEGNVTEYEYDGYGNRTLERRKDVTQPDGSKKDIISYWHYDSEGRILFTTDPESIDPNDVANPDHATTRYEYDANGNQIKVTDALGNVSESVYDNKGQLVASLYQGEVEYVTLYDKGGSDRASIDESGVITHYRYDSAGQLVETVYGDTVGLETFLEEMELADGYQPQEYTLDTIDWTKVLYPVKMPLRVVSLDAPRTRTEYSKDGRVLADIDELGNRTQYEYNPLGQLTKVTY
ncbi:putative Ig domain-containing protein, partial [Roseofilum sp. Belize Diploria]|uniref:putative Ig domain-containing protein n=1 Tax=Roseofilum sp. Belize Diploria TaxID=2821501 RepID=UPI001B0EA9C0